MTTPRTEEHLVRRLGAVESRLDRLWTSMLRHRIATAVLITALPVGIPFTLTGSGPRADSESLLPTVGWLLRSASWSGYAVNALVVLAVTFAAIAVATVSGLLAVSDPQPAPVRVARIASIIATLATAIFWLLLTPGPDSPGWGPAPAIGVGCPLAAAALIWSAVGSSAAR